MQLSSIIFYATAAALAVIALTEFCVAAFRKKRKRNAGDVLYFIFGTLLLLVSAVLCAFAVFNRFGFFGFEAQSVGSGKFTDLVLYFGGKKLLTVPYEGNLVNIFTQVGIYGVIVTAAVVVLLLVSLITLGAKTKRRMAAPAESGKPAPATEEEPAPTKSELKSGLHYHKDVFGEPDRIEYEPADEEEESGQPVGEEMPTYDEQPSEDELAPVDDDTAHDIVDEIDRLVTGERSEPGEEPIDDKLRKAIEEGYDLIGALDDSADESLSEEEQPTEEEQFSEEEQLTEEEQLSEDEQLTEEEQFSEDEQPTEEEQFPEEPYDGQASYEEEYPEEEKQPVEEEEQPEEEESLEGWAYEQDDEVSEQEDEAPAEEEEEVAVAADRKVSAGKADEPATDRRVLPRVPAYEHNAAADIPVRVRTIVRRPAARSIDEIERRADEISEPRREAVAPQKQKPAAQNPAEKKAPAEKKTEEKKAPAAKKQPAKKTAEKQRPAEKKAASERPAPAPEKPAPKVLTQKPEKEVEAQSSGLPLTRRYIILNRRSAANIFNEYLQSKREAEKNELTGSLNTIIIK